MNQEEKTRLKALFAKYVALGYTTLDIEYSGSGDSGDIESINMNDAEEGDHWSWMKQVELEGSEQNMTEHLAWEIIEQTGISGYENNEGGQGTIFVNLTTGGVEVEHEENIITTESALCTLDLFTEEEIEA